MKKLTETEMQELEALIRNHLGTRGFRVEEEDVRIETEQGEEDGIRIHIFKPSTKLTKRQLDEILSRKLVDVAAEHHLTGLAFHKDLYMFDIVIMGEEEVKKLQGVGRGKFRHIKLILEQEGLEFGLGYEPGPKQLAILRDRKKKLGSK